MMIAGFWETFGYGVATGIVLAVLFFLLLINVERPGKK